MPGCGSSLPSFQCGIPQADLLGIEQRSFVAWMGTRRAFGGQAGQEEVEEALGVRSTEKMMLSRLMVQ